MGSACCGAAVASTQPGQFIEVYNPTSADLDLTGWVVKVLLFQPSGGTTVSPYQQADLVGTIPSGNVHTVYGNFDIISNRFSRISQLHSTPHALCAVVYLVPVLIGCWLVLGIRCCDRFGATG